MHGSYVILVLLVVILIHKYFPFISNSVTVPKISFNKLKMYIILYNSYLKYLKVKNNYDDYNSPL